MVVKADWLDGDTFAAADENAHAAQTNTNATDIAARVVGEASSADSEVALFSGTGGKTIKRATGNGIPKLTSGVLGTATAGTDYVAPGGALGTPSSGTLTNATGLPISGLTASTTTPLGVGSIELGHASDTTVARSSAGNISVEGNVVYRAGGTDVPITDGGTGVSTLPSGLLKGAGTSAITAATAGTDYYAPGSTDVAVADGGTGVSTLTGIVKGNGTSAFSAATAGTDYVAPGGALGTPSSGNLANCTALPVSGITASTATALGVGSLELGHATDTTLSRSAAGQLAVEGVDVLTTSNTKTLTNKDLTSGTNTFPTFNQNTTGTAAGITGKTTPSGALVGDTDTQTLSAKTLTNPTVNNYTEGVVAIGNTGTSQTISLTSGTVQTATLTGNCTFTMPTATAGKSFVLLLKTGAGSFTATFTGVKWPAGTAPTVTTTAARLDMLTFVADGTNWYGASAQNYTP